MKILLLAHFVLLFCSLNVVAPCVGISMGSDLDLPAMESYTEILEMFGVHHFNFPCRGALLYKIVYPDVNVPESNFR